MDWKVVQVCRTATATYRQQTNKSFIDGPLWIMFSEFQNVSSCTSASTFAEAARGSNPLISPHRISQEHCIGTSLRKSSNFERDRFLRSCTLRWLAFDSQRQGKGGSSVVGRGNCPAELTNPLAQPSSHRPATTSAACPEQPRPLAASASPARLPAHRQCRGMAGSRPIDQPLAQPSQRTNLSSPARTSSLTVASAACMPTLPEGRQPRPSPALPAVPRRQNTRPQRNSKLNVF